MHKNIFTYIAILLITFGLTANLFAQPETGNNKLHQNNQKSNMRSKLKINGHDNGYGYGRDNGPGNGYGYGHGYGTGDGSGKGPGNGPLDGYGYGHGYDIGDGPGNGYGLGHTKIPPGTNAPEPISSILFALGGAGLIFYRKFRNKN